MFTNLTDLITNWVTSKGFISFCVRKMFPSGSKSLIIYFFDDSERDKFRELYTGMGNCMQYIGENRMGCFSVN